MRTTIGHAGCLAVPLLAMGAVGALAALGGVLVPRHHPAETGASVASRTSSIPSPSQPVTLPPTSPVEQKADVGGCLNASSHASSMIFDVVRLMYTPGVTDGPVRDRTLRDRATATRLAAEVAAWPQLFDNSICRTGPLGEWYTLSFAGRGDLNGWRLYIPADLCETSPAPPLCGDMASILGVSRSVRRLPQVSAVSVRVVRTPGLLILPPLDRSIADPAAATRLADDIRRLRPQAVGVPGGPPIVENCPIDFGTAYALTFSSPGTPHWTAVIHIMGCSDVTVPGWPELIDLGDTTLLADLGAALGLSPDEVSPVPCDGLLAAPGHICYPQPPPATRH